ncbi:MAG: serine/threonine protein kinase [Candidatus Obscuribacter sp.]|nr:serine/threonine protein kinase [Candidatus Obscuribacter sp.]
MLNELPGVNGHRYEPGVVVGGDYVLLRSIGRGGMGEVFAAEHKFIAGRVCALKMLAPHLVTERNWQRFEREARALARLDHGGIVKIYTMGVDRETCPYYVMELIEGETLSEYLNRSGRFSVEQAIAIFKQVASALDCAHRNSIIHRDLKPSNIMLLPAKDGQSMTVKLVDFGVAALISNVEHQRLTEIGEAVGTPLYMSPEQFVGEAAGEPCDVYSLGCTLFEALTGRPPFRGENTLQTIHMHQYKLAPTLAEAFPRGQFSNDLEYMVARMLSKLPASRYQNMAQVIHDFERLSKGKPLVLARSQNTASEIAEEPAAKTEWPFSRLQIILSAVACFTLVGALSYWALSDSSKSPQLAPVCTGLTKSIQEEAQANSKTPHSLPDAGSESWSLGMTPSQQKEFMALPTFEQKDVDGSTIFKFPEKMILGDFNIGDRTLKASGLIKVRKGILPIFSIGEDYPILTLTKLKPDSVNLEIQISSRERFGQFCKFAKGWHTVCAIRICNFDLKQSDVSLLDQLPPTKFLTFTGCRFNNVDFSACKVFDRAQVLKIDGLPKLPDDGPAYPNGLQSCIVTAGKFPTIKQMDIYCCKWPSALTSLVCKQRYITAIHIERVPLTAHDLQLLCNKTGLKELSIVDWPFAFGDVILALKQKPVPERLILTDPTLPDHWQKHVAEIPRIKLGVNGAYSYAQVASIKKMVSNFKLMPLKHYYLGDGQFTDFAPGD